MLIHRQNAGPTNAVIGATGFDPYIGDPSALARRSITIDGDALGFAATIIPARTLYNKRTADGKYVPRFISGAMTSITNSTNFDCDVPNAMRAFLTVGDFVKFYDISAGAISADRIEIDTISAADGGDTGAGFTKITCTGEVFTATPASGDLLVLSDGSEDDSDCVLVDEEVDLTLSVDQVVNGSYECTLKKSLINRADYINKHDLAGRKFYIRNE